MINQQVEEERIKLCRELYLKLDDYKFTEEDFEFIGLPKLVLVNIKSRLKKGILGWSSILILQKFFELKKGTKNGKKANKQNKPT